MQHLYEISDRGILCELSVYSCGIAPTGGHLVVADTPSQALQKFYAWRNGQLSKQTVYGFRFPQSLESKSYPIQNVIV